MPLFGPPGERIGYAVYPHAGGGPPLVLVHGFTASAASFAANLAGLCEHFTVITAELLGHGDSDAPADPALYGPAQAVDRLLQLFDFLGYEKVLLCGHSLGGAVSLRLALEAPERLHGLIVINSSSAAGTPQWREAARDRMKEMAESVRAQGTSFMKGTRLYPANGKRLDPVSRELLTRDFERLQPEGIAGTAEGLTIAVNAFERHPELSVPMLLVVGDRDVEFAPIAASFASRFPQDLLRTVHIAEAAHAANIEQPAEFEAAVVEFARELGLLARPGPPAAGGNGPRATHLLTALGGALVLAGVSLLALAVFLGADDDDGRTAVVAAPGTEGSGETVTASAPLVTAVAGTRTTGGPRISGGQPTTAAVTTPAQTASPAGSPTSVPATATAVPAVTTQSPEIEATPTPEPTAGPEPEPTPEATTVPAPPAGPIAAIAGPSSVALGGTAIFTNAASPAAEVLRVTWSVPNDADPNEQAAAVTFTEDGCYAIGMTAYFISGVTQTATMTVAAGNATCP